MISKQSIFRLSLVILLIMAITLAYFTGVYQQFETSRVREFILESGIWGPLLFLFGLCILQPLISISSSVFLIAASMIWSPIEAFLISWLGVVGSGITTFFFARYAARSWVLKKMPPRIRKYDEKLERDGFRTVFLLRFLFFTTPPVQFMIGVSGVRIIPFLGATILGTFPGTLFITQMGVYVPIWIEQYREKFWIAIAIVACFALVTGVLLFFYFYKYKRKDV